MFKTTYYHEVNNQYRIKDPYVVSFQTTALIGKGYKLFYYELSYSNKKDALKTCQKVDKFLEHIFFQADLIYFRLLSIPFYDQFIKYTRTSYVTVNSDIIQLRANITTGSLKNTLVSNSVYHLSNYIQNLIRLCPYYLTHHSEFVEQCFEHLQLLYDYFIKSYHNACLNKNINYLNFLNTEKL